MPTASSFSLTSGSASAALMPVELGDNRLGRARRHQKSAPGVGVVARNAGFDHCRDIRQTGTRVAVVTASGRKVPAWTCGTSAVTVSNIIVTRPLIRSGCANVLPL